jgi:EAL domain-containing protein (putative c-di-GMP-specific phosphodiesterase class I)
VEQPYQRDRLAERGCDLFQGWLFAPATHADEVIEMLPRISPTISDDAPRPVPVS